MQQTTILRCLKPGDMFKREGGDFRYIVSRECIGSGGNEQIYCYNLDGSSVGYYHQGNESVIPLSPLGTPCTIMDAVLPSTQCPPAPFWMCYVEGMGAPVIRHSSYPVAVAEAERLAKNSGKRVYLLHTESFVIFTPPTQVGKVIQWESL